LGISNWWPNERQRQINRTTTTTKKDMWNAAIDAVLAELRIAPPSRIGEAAFIRRVILLKELE
jgi:hypothetical protein